MMSVKGKKVLFIFFEVVMVLISLVYLLPLIFTVLNSLKSGAEATMMNFSLPSKFHFENYLTVFKKVNIFRAFLNSVMIAGISVFFSTIFATMFGYIFDRRPSKVSKTMYYCLIGALIPASFLIASLYVMVGLGLYGKIYGVIIHNIAATSPLAVFLITGFMKTVPKELDESAIIDGAKLSQLFFIIIFPQLKPIISTVAIINLIGLWNDFLTPLIYLPKPSSWTLTLAVYGFGSAYSTQWELVCAVLVMVAIPIIFAYFIAQKQIIGGLTAGAVKG